MHDPYDPIDPEQRALDEFIRRAGFRCRWRDLESAARAVTRHAVGELAEMQAERDNAELQAAEWQQTANEIEQTYIAECDSLRARIEELKEYWETDALQRDVLQAECEQLRARHANHEYVIRTLEIALDEARAERDALMAERDSYLADVKFACGEIDQLRVQLENWKSESLLSAELVGKERDSLATQLRGCERDAQRLDWLGTAGDVWIGMVWDCAHDGEFRVDVSGVRDLQGYGKTLREAIDACATLTPGKE